MKILTNITHRLPTLAAALVGLALLGSVGRLSAQYTPIGDDGIAASPKLRQFLEERKSVRAKPVAAAVQEAMACPKCKEVVVTRPDLQGKGLGVRTLLAGGVPTKQVTKHLCEGCENRWEVKGVGKAKQSVAVHRCAGCGAGDPACCNTRGGSAVATPGMEKRAEPAAVERKPKAKKPKQPAIWWNWSK